MDKDDTIQEQETDQPKPNAAEAAKAEAAPHPLQERVSELEEQLRKAEARAEEEKERYLRVTAEVDAKRKRLADEAASKIANFKLDMVRGFLRVVDNFERALQAIPRTEKPSSMRDGIEMTLKEFYRLLEDHGVQRIDCLGAPFDHTLHEAVAVRHEPGKAENEIIEVHHQGYRLGDQLLRPAQVVVNQRNKQTPAQEEGATFSKETKPTDKEVSN